MKRTTSLITLLASLSMILMAPLSGIALGVGSASSSPFCTNVPNEASTINSKLGTLISNAQGKWSDANNDWSAIWSKVDQTVAADRAKADADRTADFSKLQAKAKTTSETTAVQTYETAVNNSVSVRRAAYDSARQTFRSGVQAAISGRNSTVSGQFSSFQSSVNTAISQAESSCNVTPTQGASIRATFQASLKSARLAFQSDRQGDTTIKATVQQLITTRNAAFNAADQVMADSLNTARQALDQAFGNSSV